jgi:uncharacterized membrane protein YagU involved in acid resistance
MRINIARAAVAGIIGTAVMTVVGLYGAPLMGIPAMNPAVMLAGAMGGSMILGWMAHFAIGITLALGYAVLGGNLPGAPWVGGALYGLAPYLLAQVAVMPLMGMPFFSGFGAMAVGSLLGHLVYGATVGAVYGGVGKRQAVPASA